MNDMTTFATRDDVREVSQEYINAISTMNWHDVISSVNDSRKLLEAMWNIEKITK